MAAESGKSAAQIQRFIRLTELIPPLLQMVDEKKIAFNPAVALSYLAGKEQEDLLETMQSEERTPSLSQAMRLKALSPGGQARHGRHNHHHDGGKTESKGTDQAPKGTNRELFFLRAIP